MRTRTIHALTPPARAGLEVRPAPAAPPPGALRGEVYWLLRAMELVPPDGWAALGVGPDTHGGREMMTQYALLRAQEGH